MTVSPSIRACSNATQIPVTTLLNRLKERKSRVESHEEQQSLSNNEEDVLLDHIKYLARLGNPITSRHVKEIAFEIQRQRVKIRPFLLLLSP